MHDAAFAAGGDRRALQLRELEAGEWRASSRRRVAPSARLPDHGAHKRDVMALLDAVEPEAEAIARSQRAPRPDGELVGFNTDAPGFAAAVRRDLGMELAGASVVPFAGAGGRAHAVPTRRQRGRGRGPRRRPPARAAGRWPIASRRRAGHA